VTLFKLIAATRPGFLAPDAQFLVIDIDGTPQQLHDLLSRLQAALGSRR
jgi:hypothetical protein